MGSLLGPPHPWVLGLSWRSWVPALPGSLPPQPLLHHWVSPGGNRAPRHAAWPPSLQVPPRSFPLVRSGPSSAHSPDEMRRLLWSPLRKEAHAAAEGLAFNKQRWLPAPCQPGGNASVGSLFQPSAQPGASLCPLPGGGLCACGVEGAMGQRWEGAESRVSAEAGTAEPGAEGSEAGMHRSWALSPPPAQLSREDPGKGKLLHPPGASSCSAIRWRCLGLGRCCPPSGTACGCGPGGAQPLHVDNTPRGSVS